MADKGALMPWAEFLAEHPPGSRVEVDGLSEPNKGGRPVLVCPEVKLHCQDEHCERAQRFFCVKEPTVFLDVGGAPNVFLNYACRNCAQGSSGVDDAGRISSGVIALRAAFLSGRDTQSMYGEPEPGLQKKPAARYVFGSSKVCPVLCPGERANAVETPGRWRAGRGWQYEKPRFRRGTGVLGLFCKPQVPGSSPGGGCQKRRYEGVPTARCTPLVPRTVGDPG